MDLLAITASLSVLNGVAQEMGPVPGLVSLPAPQKAARGRERDFLFAHLALTGPADEAAPLAEDLAAGLARRFFAATGSVTSALRRAVIETNEQLLRHNLSVRTTREGALTCAVLHGDELYTLQVGEGLAFLGHNFGVERLPAQLPKHLTPLGRTAGIDIRFAYHRLQSGDMMLLADPRLAYLTGATLAPVLVDTEIESGVDALAEAVAGDTARLLLVEFADELPSTLPVTYQHSRKPPVAPRAAAAAVVAPAATSQAAPHATPRVVGPRREASSLPELAESPADSAAALETNARRVASSSARGLSRFTAWLADLLGRLRGQPGEVSVNWTLPALAALVIPVTVAAIFTSVYLQRGTNTEVAAIKDQMVTEMLRADEAGGDVAVARGHYETTLALAGEAEALRSGDLEVARMRAAAREALDRIDGVTRLSAITFYEYEASVNLATVTLRPDEGGIAVLDAANDRVLFHATDDDYHATTEEGPAIIAYGGQPAGAQVVGPLVDLMWLPGSAADTRDSVAMLDRTGVMFNYYPNLGDIRGVPLDNSSAWLEPRAMATYGSRLYVLDAGARQIWRYSLDEGYTQDPDAPAIAFSAQAELDQAVDFDLYSEDGSLVIVYADGRVRYYDTRSGRIQWDETTLLNNGLSTPLVSPSAVKLVGRGLNASIFVLDPGSSRLVQLGRGGRVLTEYRVLDELGDEVLSKARDFAVVDSPLRILIAAGNHLYLAER